VYIQKHFDANPALKRGGWAMLAMLGLQFALGLFAYLVLINDMAQSIRSGLQIILTVSHVIVGALLMASTVWTTLLAWRAPASATDRSGDATAHEPVPAPRSSVATH
jgi:cytochrome c oxidase assembly protein subunit 15